MYQRSSLHSAMPSPACASGGQRNSSINEIYIERKSTYRKGAHEPLARSRDNRIQMQEVDLRVDCAAGCGIAEVIPR